MEIISFVFKTTYFDWKTRPPFKKVVKARGTRSAKTIKAFLHFLLIHTTYWANLIVDIQLSSCHICPKIRKGILLPMKKFLMKRVLKITKRRIDGRTGYDFIKCQRNIPVDFEKDVINIIRSVRPYTMTTPDRLYALINAVKYIVKNNIPGDIVECGV
jgi:hypothetical protein